MSDDVRRAEVTEIAQANEAAERLEAYYRGEQSGIYYTKGDARAAFIEDILKVVKGYQRLRGQLEQAKIRVEQLEDAGRKLYEDVVARLRSVEELLARGKGEWPKNDYVRDETWATWQGERLALRSVLQSSGFLKCDVLHPYSPPARSAGD